MAELLTRSTIKTMMPRNPPERDWKVFRELREVALERLCERALRDATAVTESSSKTHHERFLELYTLVGKRNRDIARGFDEARRSAMLIQLAFMHRLGLLEADELDRFSSSTREKIEALVKPF
jgi:hypothetical protein